MSILVDETTRILVQGITGWQASLDVKFGLEYGAKIVAGVTPGKKGQNVHGVPVYNTVEDAVSHHEVDASVLYVPARMLKDAADEAIDAGIKLLLLIPEGVPRHDLNYILARARENGVRIIGPNTNGVISPGKSKLGGLGGQFPHNLFMRGNIGVVSRSGGMSAEISLTLKKAGLGTTTCVSMGGEGLVGTSIKEYLELFQQDDETEAVVMFGEPGTNLEEEAADYIASGQFNKPAIALIVGRFQENFPKGVSFGHSAALIGENSGSPSGKIERLRRAGVLIAETLEDIPRLAKEALQVKGAK